MLTLNPQSPTSLVLQIVTGFRAAIDSGALRAGSKAPSIRQFAHAHNVSVFTVVDAYDRLVAQLLCFAAAFWLFCQEATAVDCRATRPWAELQLRLDVVLAPHF